MSVMMLRNPAIAEEVTQDIFLKLWQALPAYDGRASPSTWLYAIARNTCLTALRSASYRRTASLDALREPAAPEIPPVRMDMERVLARLPEAQREAITLFIGTRRALKTLAECSIFRQAQSRVICIGRVVHSRNSPRRGKTVDCRAAQELILEAFIEPVSTAEQRSIEVHIAGCAACWSFARAQQELETQLQHSIRTPQLSATFRGVLFQRIRREPLSVWPDTLPDIAHLAGCGAAILLCAALLPFPARSILPVAIALTGVTYVLQSILRSLLEEWEETDW